MQSLVQLSAPCNLFSLESFSVHILLKGKSERHSSFAECEGFETEIPKKFKEKSNEISTWRALKLIFFFFFNEWMFDSLKRLTQMPLVSGSFPVGSLREVTRKESTE